MNVVSGQTRSSGEPPDASRPGSQQWKSCRGRKSRTAIEVGTGVENAPIADWLHSSTVFHVQERTAVVDKAYLSCKAETDDFSE
ncbi:Hypothetical protein NTJ_10761 [Nesidiocoris tenuis]|uniref:Uncharacterized protein n=1 Tax=Nesidiocoris tenuis TaxID=355587 RepID=A0ABN7B0J3_9HEMI|nr:Hypothetical protein NTJ_10761 [Nesidiocoris tenuis]